jgi:hypothetical protein
VVLVVAFSDYLLVLCGACTCSMLLAMQVLQATSQRGGAFAVLWGGLC